MAELLLELLSEEMPAEVQSVAAASLCQFLLEACKKSSIQVGRAVHSATPRRLVVCLQDVPLHVTHASEAQRGPRHDAPASAVEGFARSVGCNLEALLVQETSKGLFYFAPITQETRSVSEMLVPMIQEGLASITWPKTMLWGEHTMRWIRPLHNMMCLFDGVILPITYGHLTATRHSTGHRFLSEGMFEVRYAVDHQENLRKRHVILDPAERRQMILEQANALAEEKRLRLVVMEDLLDELVGLVEWPHVLLGTIDAPYMALPREVLTTSLRVHQRYLLLEELDGTLAPYFLVVSNIPPQGDDRTIITGNERVLRARLADALFFWDHDRATPLSARNTALSHIIFHQALGTVWDKSLRNAELTKWIAVFVPHAHMVRAERAAILCKADLTTEMVSEFPELQGTMGYYYALHDGEDRDVARAIAEHYQPIGADDACPTEPLSVALALADKVDSLVGLFMVGERATGSKDPYGLRRLSLGMIRILLTNQLHIPLHSLGEKAMILHQSAARARKTSPSEEAQPSSRKALLTTWVDFILERLKHSMRSEGVRHDVIEAVLAMKETHDLTRLVQQMLALQCFIQTEEGKHILTAYRRAANFIHSEEAQHHTGGNLSRLKLQDTLWKTDEERDLYHALQGIRLEVEDLCRHYRYTEAMALLGCLVAPIHQFFDHVTVLCDDAATRKMRVGLLQAICQLLDQMADFSRLDMTSV